MTQVTVMTGRESRRLWGLELRNQILAEVCQRPRIHGPRAGRITRTGVKLFVTESHKALNLAA